MGPREEKERKLEARQMHLTGRMATRDRGEERRHSLILLVCVKTEVTIGDILKRPRAYSVEARPPGLY